LGVEVGGASGGAGAGGPLGGPDQEDEGVGADRLGVGVVGGGVEGVEVRRAMASAISSPSLAKAVRRWLATAR
jgi:hypothetical protein